MPTYRTEPDGTRVYPKGLRYKPIGNRGVNKPDDPNAEYLNGRWYLPLPLLPPEQRTMPPTRPDEDAYDHMAKPRPCKCDVCARPESQRWKQLWRDEHP